MLVVRLAERVDDILVLVVGDAKLNVETVVLLLEGRNSARVVCVARLPIQQGLDQLHGCVRLSRRSNKGWYVHDADGAS